MYDPARQWGLKPESSLGGGGATYVVAGHVVSGGPSKDMFIGESYGRDAQAKAARKTSARDADRALQHLLKRDKEGMKAVLVARDHIQKHAKAAPHSAVKKGKQGRSSKRRREATDSEDESATSDAHTEDIEGDDKKLKKGYSTNLIRSLGFDPAAKDGPRAKDLDVQKKVRINSQLCFLHVDGTAVHIARCSYGRPGEQR